MPPATPAGSAVDAALAGDPVLSTLEVFARNGGLASGDELSVLLRRHCEQPLSQLARWIVGGDIAVIEWRGQTLIPLFQFDLDQMTIRPEAGAVIAELAGRSFDSEQTSRWLAAPNTELGGRRPLECLDSDLPAVLAASRAERRATAS